MSYESPIMALDLYPCTSSELVILCLPYYINEYVCTYDMSVPINKIPLAVCFASKEMLSFGLYLEKLIAGHDMAESNHHS